MNRTEHTGPLPSRPPRGDVGRAAAGAGPAKKGRLGFIVLATLAALLGLAGGVAVGVPGLVERAGQKAIARLEDRFGLRVDAAAVDWTWGGQVRARGITVRDEAGEVLATADALEVDSVVDAWERRVRVERVLVTRPVMKVTRDAAGRTNLDRLVAALKRAGSAGSDGTGSGVKLEPTVPLVTLEDATLAVDAVLPPLPFGLALPGRATFEGGRITLRPTAPSPDGHLGATPVKLDVAFASSSIDPGQGLSLSAEGPLAGPPTRVALEPSRPVRFWLQERVVGVGGVALTSRGVELGPLQLSVPIPKGGAAQVAAAATCDKVVLEVAAASGAASAEGAPLAVFQRLKDAIGGAAMTGGGATLSRSTLAAALSVIDQVRLVRPVVSLSIDAEGHHDFADLVPDLHLPARSLPAGDDLGLVRVVTDASLAASDKLLGTTGRLGASTTKPLSARVAGPFEGLDRVTRQRLPELARLFLPSAMKHLAIEDGEVMLAVPGAQVTLAGLALDAQNGETRVVKLDVASVQRPDAPTLSGAEERATLSLLARLGADAALHVELGAKGFALGLLEALGVALPHLDGDAPDGKPGPAQGRIAEAALTFDGALDGARWEVSGKVALEDAVFAHRSVAKDPLRDLDVTLSGSVLWNAAEQRLAIADALIESRGVAVKVALDVADAERRPKVHLALDLPETPVQRVFDALPRELVPLLRGLRVEGMLAWRVVVDLDTAAPEQIRIDSHPTARGLQVVTLGEVIDFGELRGSHSYGILLGDGTPGQRLVGPGTGSWIPLSSITPYLPLALTTTEDGTFYSNDGISTSAMKESVATNLARGSFARGASTLTQQLVKNLYLGSDKTLSRKLQEVFIAWQMSQNLSKDEVMALYLNTIEFGPGIYGIGDAAWHWFGKRPIDLTLTEAIFLASIIPGPRRYYSFFLQGEVTPRWSAYLQALLKVMVQRGKITEQELLAAAPYVPIFRGAGGGYTDTAPPDDFDELPDKDDTEE